MSRKLRKKEIWIYAGMTAPAILLYLFTVVGPFLTGTIPSSFRNWNIIKGVNQWNGIANYVRMFTKDQVFLNSIGFTIKLGLGSLIFVNSFALAAALMLEGRNVRAAALPVRCSSCRMSSAASSLPIRGFLSTEICCPALETCCTGQD